jgi:hypothetical protein
MYPSNFTYCLTRHWNKLTFRTDLILLSILNLLNTLSPPHYTIIQKIWRCKDFSFEVVSTSHFILTITRCSDLTEFWFYQHWRTQTPCTSCKLSISFWLRTSVNVWRKCILNQVKIISDTLHFCVHIVLNLEMEYRSANRLTLMTVVYVFGNFPLSLSFDLAS